MHNYLAEKATHYQFDSPDFSHHFEIAKICFLSPEDRKKLVLFFYYLLHSDRQSSSYNQIEKQALSAMENIPTEAPGSILTWEEFKALYKRNNVQTLPFIGYGSLLNKKDVRRTLPRKKKFMPVIAFGAKRVFKYGFDCDPSKLEGSDHHEIAALGLDLSYHREHYFNGVLFDLKEDEVDPLAEREEKYQLRKLPYIAMNSSGIAEIKEAYSLVYPQNDGANLLPSLNYLYLIVSGNLDDLGFIRFFFETTYLANGMTTAAVWIENEAYRYFASEQ